MTNNDILRRLRYTFDLGDDQMIALFALGDHEVTRAQVSDWMKKEDDPAYKVLEDRTLAMFLNGFIADKRGKRPGPAPKPESKLNNNIILRKLKIALEMRDEDIVDIMQLVGLSFSKHEINAFFRKFTQNQYRVCQDQFLRNFLKGLQVQYRIN